MRGCCAATTIDAAGARRLEQVRSGALYTPTDGRAEPPQAAPAIAEAARAAGATILTECAVRGIETQGGRVSGVVTEKGRIACDAVVLAGGAWSRLFCGNVGDRPAAAQGAGLGVAHRAARAAGRRSPPAARCSRSASGWTAATRSRRRNANVADIVPDTFRLLLHFLPTLRQNYGEIRLRFGRRFLEEWRTPAALVAGRGDAVRGGARARSGAEAGHAGRGARGAVTQLSRRSRRCRWRRAGAG